MAEKKIKSVELRQMSDDQLGLTLRDSVKSLFQLRFRSSAERTTTPSDLTKLRRNVARIKTVQRQRELAKGQPK